jgi:hypothetical protein
MSVRAGTEPASEGSARRPALGARPGSALEAGSARPGSVLEAGSARPGSALEAGSARPAGAALRPGSAPDSDTASQTDAAPQTDGAPGPTAPPRIYTGELISFLSALMLLPIMFLLDWYGVLGLPLRARRSGITTAENAWRVLTELRWLMLLAILAGLGSVMLHVSQRKHGTKTDTSLVVTAVGTLTAALVGYRVLIDLPNSSSVVDVKIGAYLGLLCTIGIAIGGYESMRQVRERAARVVQRSRAKTQMESRPDAR